MADPCTTGRLHANHNSIHFHLNRSFKLNYSTRHHASPLPHTSTNTYTKSHIYKHLQSRRVECNSIVESVEEQPTTTTNSTSTIQPEFSYTTPDGRWRVRQINKASPEEIRQVVKLQTEGFHVGNPIPFIDSTLKNFFQAEVLSEMSKKLRYNPEEQFACLVVEPASPTNTYTGPVLGVCEVSYIDEKEILKSLEPGTTAFVYIASMAVDPVTRRQGAATAMLIAAERIAQRWDEKQSLLHVYQDNIPAVEVYKANGYEIIFQDAPWLAKLAVRPRFLMRKKFEGGKGGVGARAEE